MKKLFGAILLAAGLTFPSQAAVNIVVDGSTEYYDFDGEQTGNDIPKNWFESKLLAAGYDNLVQGATLETTSAGTFHFYLLGAESAYRNSFSVNGGLLFQENLGQSNVAWQGWTNTWLGSFGVGAATALNGSIFQFDSVQGVKNIGLGAQEFGIYHVGGVNDLNGHTNLIFAFDDNGADVDDNHDDLVILAKFIAAVPEPATWLMMIMGFGLVGIAARRRERTSVSVA
ncbi:PEPxxWA-CTERM sorting domain-containing protein [Gimibacter soli]|uniref:PEPxxWA-CTERM sorting domain-containing protein n=1 Tax=Gimibacter soli TaxID=3024400 RepID=A0AAF0BKP0_9PROT|nr:PEPxxWA-CTERM sorting domain-containing protein [Gimibacter soli]WCL53177.1 PEPxxWA-CTERM sorting domain-containing protein [Gimibacter soli]